MTRSDFLKAVLQGASAYVPGGMDIKEGVESLLNRDDNPANDVDEVASALAQVVVGAVLAAENLSGRDLVHDELFKELVINLQRDIKLLQMVLVKKPAVN